MLLEVPNDRQLLALAVAAGIWHNHRTRPTSTSPRRLRALIHINHLGAWDGVWWAVTTVTTVGWGDSYPTTTAGRIIAVIVMLVGIGFVAILTAAAAERFTRARSESADVAAVREQLDEITRRLDAMQHR